MARHPWVHAHALAEDGRELECGQVVDLVDHDGNWVARGVVNPASRLRVRLYAFDSSIQVGEESVACSGSTRQLIDGVCAGAARSDGAERLIFSESDLMSGLIVDRYADCLGVQFTSGGLLRWKDSILDHLQIEVRRSGDHGPRRAENGQA